MALFRNFGVNRRNRLCGVPRYASAQFLDFLELAENCSFLDRKLISALNENVDRYKLVCFGLRPTQMVECGRCDTRIGEHALVTQPFGKKQPNMTVIFGGSF